MSDLKMKALQKLTKAFRGTLPQGKVGILGSGKRKEGNTSNAEVGAVHEYGTTTHPMRSWLRMPITMFLDKKLTQSGAWNESTLKEVIKTGQIIPYVQKITITAYEIVMEGFATEGFGTWAAWKTPGYSNNANQILLDTQQLRNSVEWKVE